LIRNEGRAVFGPLVRGLKNSFCISVCNLLHDITRAGSHHILNARRVALGAKVSIIAQLHSTIEECFCILLCGFSGNPHFFIFATRPVII
jgi:hypothetical protein